jgi:hypothetical protein
MSEVSKRLDPPTLRGTPVAISLQESGCGTTRSTKPVGETEKFGRAHAPANHSPRQAKEQGLLTSGTYGPPSIGSSRSAVLTGYLENKLRVKTASRGSILWRLTWSQKATPAGRLLPALRASRHRSPVTDSILWVSPSARDYRDLSMTSAHLAARSRHQRDAITQFLTLGGNWKQGPALYRILMGLPSGWHESFYMDMATHWLGRKRRPSSKPSLKASSNEMV